MTVIVGYTQETECSIYFDSAIADSDTILSSNTPKAFRHAGNGLVGVAGSWRVINLVSSLSRRKLTPQTIVDTLKNVKGEDEAIQDMEILCAWPNRPLVIIQSDFSIIEIDSPYMAVGSGSAYALGFLEACFQEDVAFSDEELTGAVRVAAKYSTSVAEPVKSLHCA